MCASTHSKVLVRACAALALAEKQQGRLMLLQLTGQLLQVERLPRIRLQLNHIICSTGTKMSWLQIILWAVALDGVAVHHCMHVLH